jgi:hypothetical protein
MKSEKAITRNYNILCKLIEDYGDNMNKQLQKSANLWEVAKGLLKVRKRYGDKEEKK